MSIVEDSRMPRRTDAAVLVVVASLVGCSVAPKRAPAKPLAVQAPGPLPVLANAFATSGLMYLRPAAKARTASTSRSGAADLFK